MAGDVMGLIARVTTTDNRVFVGSTITVTDDSGTRLAEGLVPERVDSGGYLAPARICQAMRELGYEPAGGDYYGSLRQHGDYTEFDVEPAP